MKFSLFIFLTLVVAGLGITHCSDNKNIITPIPVTPFEKTDGKATTTYEEAIKFYKQVSRLSEKVNIDRWGETDAGLPLHLVTYDADGIFDPEIAHQKNKVVFFINNGIHPGEPCGIDASMLFIKKLLTDTALAAMAKKVHLAIIPVYNIGGALNRDTLGRVNQTGPESYGFRGNAANYNLNRDFTKLDTKNARAFVEIFQHLKPDVFIDTHTSDGADYQHAMTLIANQPDATGEIQGDYLRNQMLPFIYKKMDSLGYPMTPYVWPMKRTPDEGIRGFYDSPRYSSGYAALFQCLSFESEAHMLKPFDERVNATLALFESMLNTILYQHQTILDTKTKTLENTMKAATYNTNWEMDTSRYTMIEFMGYEPEYITSPVTNLPLLRYNQDRPYEKSIPYYEFFIPSKTIDMPKAYIIPQAWDEVIERLALNGVTYHTFEQDTSLEVTWYKISDSETYPRIYEGHYLHYQTEVSPDKGSMQFRAGDVWVDTGQEGIRFILEMLEPECVDSYFNWNFFDPVLEQKEYFGEYYFTLLAQEVLENNPDLATKFKQKQQSDPEFTKSNRAQLQFIYENSPYQEPGFMRYPVYRVER